MTLPIQDSDAAQTPKGETMVALAAEINRKLVGPYVAAAVLPLVAAGLATAYALTALGLRGVLAGIAVLIFALAIMNAALVRPVRRRVSTWALEQCRQRGIVPKEMEVHASSRYPLALSIITNDWPE